MSGQENTPPTRATRSGRRVREPTRYEPDPSIILEDDYSDASSYVDSDDESVCEHDGCIDEEDFVSEIGESDSESDDDSMSEDEYDDESVDGEEEEVDYDDDDVIDFDCLTDNASDGSFSSDEED